MIESDKSNCEENVYRISNYFLGLDLIIRCLYTAHNNINTIKYIISYLFQFLCEYRIHSMIYKCDMIIINYYCLVKL